MENGPPFGHLCGIGNNSRSITLFVTLMQYRSLFIPEVFEIESAVVENKTAWWY